MPAWTRAAAALFAVGFGANQFASMLPVYRAEDGASAAEVTALFGAYAVGIIPALLVVAPISDRLGRRRVMRPVIVLSFVATVVLLVGGHSIALLVLGRLLAGIASGAAFAPGTAWVKELSAGSSAVTMPAGTAQNPVPAGTGARRAAIALSAGFGTGPLVTGVMAQWLPAPTALPYVPHLVLTVLVAVIMWRTPEIEAAASPEGEAEPRRVAGVLRSRLFLLAVVPTAPWVFGSVTIAFTTVPSIVPLLGPAIAVGGALVALSLWTGVLVQPWGRGRAPRRTIGAGVASGLVGMVVAIAASASGSGWLVLLAAVGLGAAYGLILVGGLTLVEEIASPTELGTVTAVFYSLTYLGFAAPYLGTLLLSVLAPVPAMLLLAGLLAATLPLTLTTRGRTA